MRMAATRTVTNPSKRATEPSRSPGMQSPSLEALRGARRPIVGATRSEAFGRDPRDALAARPCPSRRCFLSSSSCSAGARTKGDQIGAVATSTLQLSSNSRRRGMRRTELLLEMRSVRRARRHSCAPPQRMTRRVASSRRRPTRSSRAFNAVRSFLISLASAPPLVVSLTLRPGSCFLCFACTEWDVQARQDLEAAANAGDAHATTQVCTLLRSPP